MQLAEDVLPEELVSGLGLGEKEKDPGKETAGTASGTAAGSASSGKESPEPEPIPVTRVSFRKEAPSFQATPGLVPSVPAYDPGADLSNVFNRDQFSFEHMSSEAKDFLAQVEREKLAPMLAALSRGMLEKSLAQYDALKGTSWEGAARRNAAFFTIGLNLQEAESARDPEVQQIVDTELDKIYNASISAPCALFGASDSFYSGTHDEEL